jgi:hypothetical protein
VIHFEVRGNWAVAICVLSPLSTCRLSKKKNKKQKKTKKTKKIEGKNKKKGSWRTPREKLFQKMQ